MAQNVLFLLDATDGTKCTLGRYEAIKMHDLLREMALRITNVKPRENLGIVISSISAFHSIVDTFIEKVLDFGLKKFKSISDFIEQMETLERNVKQLSDKALDVKTKVENRKRSGKKKRNREVGSWFDEVMKVEV
ncbi:hypothetical protein FXO38_06778 [Capsicum annuum]|nr:hypothetical protein FXO38_06778 [Capsicum annuum]